MTTDTQASVGARAWRYRRCAALVGLGLTLALLGSGLGAQALDPRDRPYAVLREGYAAADPDHAASAYAEDALYTELYPATAPVLRAGRPAIAVGMAELFRALGITGGSSGADLNFRFVSRSAAGDVGFYRLRAGRGADQRVFFGSFATRRAGGLLVADTSGPGDRAGFEDASGSVLFEADEEELDGAYYDQFTGLYGTSTCPVVITRSVRRLFALDECTGTWRGLQRISGREWSAGNSLIDPVPRVRYGFAADPAGGLAVTTGAASEQRLMRRAAFRVAPVQFGNAPKLAGTLYLPASLAGPRTAGVVMVHGSGYQDRNGYASLIALMAQRLARNGLVVLTYDKRGVGGSEGDWASAGFAELARDAAAGMALLRQHPAVDPARVGLAGSSQAGWIAAEAIRQGTDPAFTILLGAAGSALNVTEQNLYNTRVRMQCAGLRKADIDLALRQQRAFFAARNDPAHTPELARLSTEGRTRPGLGDWLFPDTPARSAQPEWYDVLDTGFDPRPVWRGYRGKAYFLFGMMDDSTPTTVAVQRLASIPAARVVTVAGMHHIGLRASSVCQSDIATLDQLHPQFLTTLDRWARELTNPQ